MQLDRRELVAVVAVFAGGCIGALARVWLGRALPAGAGDWPWATLLANVGGSFLLGYLVTHLHERRLDSTYRRAFLGTGLCGALTTFSAFQLETVQLAGHGHAGLAAAYVALSLTLGLAAFTAATGLARRREATA